MRAPWYVIGWRLVWAVPTYAALLLFCLFAGLGWGPQAARRAWDNAR